MMTNSGPEVTPTLRSTYLKASHGRRSHSENQPAGMEMRGFPSLLPWVTTTHGIQSATTFRLRGEKGCRVYFGC